jgi:transcriptional regulator with XRE-family HTH domain
MPQDDSHKQFGRRVKSWRQARGFSQEQLAEAIERSVETVSNIERGQASTGIATAFRIAQVLDIEPALLFGDPLSPKRDHPLIEALVTLLAGRDPSVIQAVLDQATILIQATERGR